MQGEDRDQLERYFLQSPDRRQKLSFASALNKHVSEVAAAKTQRIVASKTVTGGFLQTTFVPSYLRIAASILVLVGAGAVTWWAFFPESDVKKGLIALNSAYRLQRPIESRISALDYAPFSTTRGPGTERIDESALHLAESTLLSALRDKSTSALHHALGEVYLSERRFDEAIKEFEAALLGEPKNSRLYSDLGAAWLEKGKRDLESAKSDVVNRAGGDGLEELGRSLENLNKALELDNNLAEALFNRALCYQSMKLPRQAEQDWQEYLKRDSSSPWAEEAKRNLKFLKENGRKVSRTSDDALRDFVKARRAGDDNTAWKVASESYTSAGNEVTNRLLDSFLEHENAGESTEAHATLADLSYLANLELTKTGDRYTSDLVTYYKLAIPTVRPALTNARGHMKAGYKLFEHSKFSEAIGEYNQAKLDYSRAGDLIEKIFVDYRLAHCHVLLEDLREAQLAFNRLLAACEKNEYRWLIAQCLFGLAHASFNNSEYSKASEYSDRALAKFEHAGDVNGVARCLTQVAGINHALNRVPMSLSYLARALALAGEREVGPKQQWGIMVQIALSMSSLQLPGAALLYQREALGIALERGMPLLVSRSYGYVGSAYAEMKMFPEAVNEATKAFDTGMKTGDLEIMANASQQLGDIHRQAGECAMALDNYDRSIELYGRKHFEYYRYRAHRGKLLCFIDGSDDTAVSAELRTLLDLSEEYRAKINIKSQRDSFFDLQQSVYDIAIRHAFTKKDPIAAFEYSERSRARSLLDAMHRDPEVLPNIYAPDLKLQEVALPMSLAEVQEKIPGGAQIVQYAVLDDRLLMWVVTRSEVHYREVHIEAQMLSEKVRGYLKEVIKRPAGDGVQPLERSKDLYNLLVAPIEPFLDRTKFLCLVPDKILNYLPFQALVSPATAKYLIEDFEIGTAPSSSVFAHLSALAKGKAANLDESLLSVGNPSFSRTAFDSLVDLPSAASEAQAVSAFYPKPHARVLLGPEARETTIKAELVKCDVAHLAMHYVLNGRSEMLSGFPVAAEHSTLSDGENADGFLQASEIYGMKLPRTRLVVLSACQTGIEQAYRGEGAVSVARPFLIAGVPVVVASLWPVDSGATAELMVNFHKHRIRDELPVTQALKESQIEMAYGQDIRYRHPYYWAPFVSIGGRTPY